MPSEPSVKPADHPSTPWRKSSYSGADTANCVEVAELPGATAIRDSQHPERCRLVFPATEWTAFLSGVRTDALNL